METRINRSLIEHAGYHLVDSTRDRYRKIEIYENNNRGLVYDTHDRRILSLYLKNEWRRTNGEGKG